ncbi:hypothetical protein B484DRAFT_397353 [Ochromonadaceae sp. CCMP2298]|nr:hypothetical protein B484DRAFT_397353 [Ochromonadaceae sp. CCMP2298]|mmetsp:Transcript_11316/g.25169  ORF Transcript_11316/g.25169 Transcript_11316/m.25169 type:complete len:662 (-) Transcript_11316:825-2810(-)
MILEEKIHELFVGCSGSNGTADFKAICKVLWMSLTNAVSVVDLAGVFTITVPGNGIELLNADSFTEFIKAFARLRFPTSPDFCNLVLDEVRGSKGLRSNTENPFFASVMDKNVIRILLKYDLPLRRAYSNFCGQSVRVGGILNWDEVKSLSIGMEISGFISFAGAYSLIPEHVSTQQCEIMFRDVLTKYPLVANASSQNADILFPQFQILLISAALERNENLSKRDATSNGVYAKKVINYRNKPIAESVNDLLREIGISKSGEPLIAGNATLSSTVGAGTGDDLSRSPRQNAFDGKTTGDITVKHSGNSGTSSEANLFTGTVILPNSDKPENMHSSSLNHSRQAMMLRMEHLFDEVETRVLDLTAPDSEVLLLLSAPKEEILDAKVRLPSKPVVIGDALPVPASCPDSVEQLLEASLAHHNLGSFEDSLKFLEAARIQMRDLQNRALQEEKAGDKEDARDSKLMYMDLDMYVTLSKGNVYQSCGDDEQSLLNYLEGWAASVNFKDKDWEIICVNAIGMLAYYNLRYDVAILCFNAVVTYRAEAYGEDSPDTATAYNNEACCLYCLDKRGEARVRFEKAWNRVSKALGHRAPRAVTAWKNLEKARRAHAPIHNKKDLKESMQMRPDAGRLLFGGTFTIQALAPPEPHHKKKGGGGKKKGKKK